MIIYVLYIMCRWARMIIYVLYIMSKDDNLYVYIYITFDDTPKWMPWEGVCRRITEADRNRDKENLAWHSHVTIARQKHYIEHYIEEA